MADEIEELRATMQQIDQLLTRFELDVAARVHVIDYQATIAALCDAFGRRMRELQLRQRHGPVGEKEL